MESIARPEEAGLCLAADDADLSPERDGLDAERGRGVAGEQGGRSE